jgi:RNA polymerase sigma-70 factor (ECF subfamily)
LPWILGIAANLCAVERRRAARERDAVRRLAGHRALDEEDALRLVREIDAANVAPRLRDALARLPRGERAVAELVLLDELTPTEAAAALGLHPAAVRMRLTRARRKLRSVVEERARPIERFEEVST